MSTVGESSTIDLPIALRRAKRRSSAVSPTKPNDQTTTDSIASRSITSDQLTTPSKQRSKKRVRFSDPGASAGSSAPNTTGLTPFVRRASLATPRHRVSEPALTPISNDNEVQFTPFRQVLDDRCKRRIRRNGLSKELNDYEADKKIKVELEKQVQEKDEELRRLREELEQAKYAGAEDDPFADETASSQRIDEVEAELAALRESFNGAAAAEDDELADINWDRVNVHKAGATPGLPSDGGDTIQIYEDEDAMIADAGTNTEPLADLGQDAELLAMALDLETAKQEKRQLFQELRSHMPGALQDPTAEMHFADSPSRSRDTPESHFLSLQSPPKDFLRNISAVLKATTSRAEDAELALHNLEQELKSLGFAGSTSGGVIREIVSQFRAARLDLERAVPGETVLGFENAQVLPEIILKLKVLVRQVSDRESELKTMRDQQKTFKGNFEHSLLVAEKANARVRELEDAIETGAEEMLGMRMKGQALEKDGLEKDKTVSALIAALEKYREDVTRMEQLVTQLEQEMVFKIQEAKEVAQNENEQQVSDLEAKVSAEERGRRAAETSSIERLAKIQELEVSMQTTQQHAMDVQLQLNTLSASKEESEFNLKAKLHSKDEQSQAALGALNTRISNLSTALASANAEVDKLKIHKSKLEEHVKKEVEQGQWAVEIMQAEVLKGLQKANESKNHYLRGSKIRVANAEMDSEETGRESTAEPMTPVSLVRFVDVEADADEEHVEGSVKVGRGKSRRSGSHRSNGKRRYDSGLGMGTLSEEDETDATIGEFSSEADYETIES